MLLTFGLDELTLDEFYHVKNGLTLEEDLAGLLGGN